MPCRRRRTDRHNLFPSVWSSTHMSDVLLDHSCYTCSTRIQADTQACVYIHVCTYICMPCTCMEIRKVEELIKRIFSAFSSCNQNRQEELRSTWSWTILSSNIEKGLSPLGEQETCMSQWKRPEVHGWRANACFTFQIKSKQR